MPDRPATLLSDRLGRGDTILSAWVGTPAPALVETLLGAGFDAAVLDMQHGGFDELAATAGIVAAALAGKPALVRIPGEAVASAARVREAGAAAVIAPMINSAQDAERLAAFCKYPPLGTRSWGPGRATALSGRAKQDYLEAANGIHLAFAMVETRAALDAVDEILAVPGIDGVFVGPSDLSITLSRGAALDPFSPEVDAALDRVAGRAAAAGKVAGMFCFSGQQARTMAGRGFRLLPIATDLLLLETAARAETAAARG